LPERLNALEDERRWGWEHWTEGAGEIPAIRSRLAKLKRDERRTLSLPAAGFSYREIGQLTDWTHTKVKR
jgi:DNA-directed RNA polymerase specialized sigma24 family protein